MNPKHESLIEKIEAEYRTIYKKAKRELDSFYLSEEEIMEYCNRIGDERLALLHRIFENKKLLRITKPFERRESKTYSSLPEYQILLMAKKYVKKGHSTKRRENSELHKDSDNFDKEYFSMELDAQQHDEILHIDTIFENFELKNPTTSQRAKKEYFNYIITEQIFASLTQASEYVKTRAFKQISKKRKIKYFEDLVYQILSPKEN